MICEGLFKICKINRIKRYNTEIKRKYKCVTELIRKRERKRTSKMRFEINFLYNFVGSNH